MDLQCGQVSGDRPKSICIAVHSVVEARRVDEDHGAAFDRAWKRELYLLGAPLQLGACLHIGRTSSRVDKLQCRVSHTWVGHSGLSRCRLTVDFPVPVGPMTLMRRKVRIMGSNAKMGAYAT